MHPDPPRTRHATATLPPTAGRSWSISPIAWFVAMLTTLLAMALWGVWVPITHPRGMPDDPEVAAARATLAGELPIPGRGLMLVSAFAGESPQSAPESLPLPRLSAAHGHLLAARTRHPRDLRLETTLAHLELASGRFEKAERDYRALLEHAPHHGEARLGLGIALAMRADWADPNGMSEPERGLALEALAQFTNVDRDDPVHPAAVADRALLLAALGRRAAALAALDAALADGAPPPWSERYHALRVQVAR